MDGWLRVGVGVAIVAHRMRRSLDDMSCASDLPTDWKALFSSGERLREGGRWQALNGGTSAHAVCLLWCEEVCI